MNVRVQTWANILSDNHFLKSFDICWNWYQDLTTNKRRILVLSSRQLILSFVFNHLLHSLFTGLLHHKKFEFFSKFDLNINRWRQNLKLVSKYLKCDASYWHQMGPWFVDIWRVCHTTNFGRIIKLIWYGRASWG